MYTITDEIIIKTYQNNALKYLPKIKSNFELVLIIKITHTSYFYCIKF
jgi:hypothetical protein